MVARRGEEVSMLYLVSSGQLYLQSTIGKQNIVVGIARAGQMVGDTRALLNSGRWTTDVVTSYEAHVFAVGKEAFRTILEMVPRIAFNLLAMQEAQLRYAREIATTFVAHDIENRLLRYLIGLVLQSELNIIEGPIPERGIVVGPFPDQETLSHIICCSRESLNRILRSHQRRGWIDYESYRRRVWVSPVFLGIMQRVVGEEQKQLKEIGISGLQPLSLLTAPVLVVGGASEQPKQLSAGHVSRALPPATQKE